MITDQPTTIFAFDQFQHTVGTFADKHCPGVPLDGLRGTLVKNAQAIMDDGHPQQLAVLQLTLLHYAHKRNLSLTALTENLLEDFKAQAAGA